MQISSYEVATPLYEGPLDLLLQLIERAELDITKLALAQVTDQYLAYLKKLHNRQPEEVSAFLVIAARLIQIKSEALLPRPPVHDLEEEDPGEALARQLIIYKRFKEIANHLANRQDRNLRTYTRIAPSPKINISPDFGMLDINELISAARSAFTRIGSEPELGTIVSPPRLTIREKIGAISTYLRTNNHGTFKQLLSNKPFRLEIVVTFLALLELVKRRLLIVQQNSLFGDIEIEIRDGDWGEIEKIELEFGE